MSKPARFAIPYAVISLIAKRVSGGDLDALVWTSPGGSVTRAYPIEIDGMVRRVEFTVNEYEGD